MQEKKEKFDKKIKHYQCLYRLTGHATVKFPDYDKYGKDIAEIIKSPTYVAKNPNQGSIEYIKEYKIEDEFVLVAVRISNKGTMFAKTLFTMTERKKNIYLRNGYAKKYE